MIRTYKYPLRPSAEQRRTFGQWLGLCCGLYNAALEQRITWYRRAGKSVTYSQQTAELTELRRAEPDYEALPVAVARSPLRRLDRAFKAFFRRVKSKAAKAGFPRFRSRSRYDSFGVDRRWSKVRRDDTDARNGWIRMPKLGLVRFRMHREMVGTIRDITITKDTRGRWFVCFACDVGEAPAKRPVASATGIDLGLTSFAVLSDGTEVVNPRYFRRSEESLARAQRVLARKKRGSNSRRKAKRSVARVHERIRNQRRDFHYKVAVDLVRRYDLIAHEDLNIAGLAKTRLAKSIHDVGWGQFIEILTRKAEEAGVHVIAVDPRNTTQECSSCGQIVPKGLGDRVHACDCGTVLSRDHNAAINVLARGLRAVPALACGPESHRVTEPSELAAVADVLPAT
jgi:putative transposase